MDHRLTFLGAPAFLLDQTQLQQINNRNAALCEQFALSGLFLYLNGSSLEVIEGPKEHVDQYFELIESYKWHSRLIVLGREAIERRLFEFYLVAYKLPGVTELTTLVHLLSSSDLYQQVNERERTVLKVIRSFYKNNLNN